MLDRLGASIGFADVGAGGALKDPWQYLPEQHLTKFNFEPTGDDGGLPVCVSDKSGVVDFHIAKDERASSLHEACATFVERFGLPDTFSARTIQVSCTTLDEYFAGRHDAVDAIDINAEGHDYQVLRGGTALLSDGFVKLIKVEFELTAVWHGQGWFGDIDTLLRDKNFELANIEIGFRRPAKVSHIYHKGEPMWGKAYYVPSIAHWKALMARADSAAAEMHAIKAVALTTAADLPGRAYDALDAAAPALKRFDAAEIKREIAGVFDWARVENGIESFKRLAGGVKRVFVGRSQ